VFLAKVFFGLKLKWINNMNSIDKFFELYLEEKINRIVNENIGLFRRVFSNINFGKEIDYDISIFIN
jgi:hypothetical protein